MGFKNIQILEVPQHIVRHIEIMNHKDSGRKGELDIILPCCKVGLEEEAAILSTHSVYFPGAVGLVPCI